MKTVHKIAFAAAVGLAQFIAGQASADVVTITRDGAGGLTIFSPGDAPVGSTARMIEVPAAHSDAADARARRWLAFCKPTITTDSLGVEYLNYAKPGCEFGRDR